MRKLYAFVIFEVKTEIIHTVSIGSSEISKVALIQLEPMRLAIIKYGLATLRTYSPDKSKISVIYPSEVSRVMNTYEF